MCVAHGQGIEPTICGNGEQTRDFTYVANVVGGVLRATEAEDAAGTVTRTCAWLRRSTAAVA